MSTNHKNITDVIEPWRNKILAIEREIDEEIRKETQPTPRKKQEGPDMSSKKIFLSSGV